MQCCNYDPSGPGRRASARAAFVVLSAVFAVLSCGGTDITSPGGNATVRLVNASPTVGPVDVLVGDQVVAQGIGTLTSGACVTVPAGLRTISFRSEGAIIATTDPALNPGREYAALVFNSAAGNTAGVIANDPLPPTEGLNAISFVNVSPVTGDVFVTEPDEDPEGIPSFIALTPLQLTVFTVFSNQRTRTLFFATGTTEDPIAEVLLPVLSSRVGTVVFTGAAPEGGDSGVVIQSCPPV